MPQVIDALAEGRRGPAAKPAVARPGRWDSPFSLGPSECLNGPIPLPLPLPLIEE